MVKVVVAGGSGNVAREIVGAILSKNKHEVIVLTRKGPGDENAGGTKWIKTDYHDKKALVKLLRGVDVVLSFIPPLFDPENTAHKNLIDASIEAGVKRFAPSEWATSSNGGIPIYAGKEHVREYLESVNREKKVLEYTLFQPGLFLNFFTYPFSSAKHLVMSVHYIDFEYRQAILVDDGQQPVTFTLVQDLAAVVAEALDYEGEWPAVGGVQGWQTTSAELIKLGEKIRGGGQFTIYPVSSAELETEGLKTPWVPLVEHPAIPRDKAEDFSRTFTGEALKGIPRGAWAVTAEWNELLPSIKFVNPEEFLKKYWA